MDIKSQDHTILPPLVCGRLHGHLTMKVDEILWCRKCPGAVVVESKWWGDQHLLTFRPSNILTSTDSPKKEVVRIFDVTTSLPLFEIYLRNCDQLELFVLKEETKELIGKTYIKCLYQIATDFQYQSYFPIVNSFGNRIGDLHVGFSLWMKPRKSTFEKDIGLLCTDSVFESKEQEDIQLKKKKGCNTCFYEKRPIMNEFKPPKLILPVPPNTERSNYSDTVISEILIKGQRLRDAMVMSVLEDCDVLKSDKNINLFSSDFGQGSRQCSDRPPSQRCSSRTPFKEQETVVDYLLGKQMSEEEEAKALETLRTTSPTHSLLELVELHKEDDNEEETKSQVEPESVKNEQKQEPLGSSVFESENDTPHMNLNKEYPQPLPPEYDKVNCIRLTVKNLCLTPHGLRKVNLVQNKKSRYKGEKEAFSHPVTTYFLECHMDRNSLSQTQAWKVKPERFCSRRQIDNIVYFGQSSVYLVPTPFTLSGLNSVLKSMTWLVCWKHLNQQTPSLLGSVDLDSRTQVQGMETIWKLPVETADGTYGTIEMLLELGRNKKHFGNVLLEEELVTRKTHQHNGNIGSTVQMQPNILEEKKKHIKNISSKKQKQTTELVMNEKRNISNKNKSKEYIPSVCESLVSEKTQFCIICRSQIVDQALKFDTNRYPSLCVGCQIPRVVDRKPALTPIQSPLVTHEFVFRIESVKDFPVFSQSEEEVKCYIDYKFLEVDIFGKVRTAHDTVTSKVLSCDQEVVFASDHLHRLSLPCTTTLSSCLLSYKPGITLQLWLRYFKPSPRDHMVAMAHLPMSKLSLLEFQFKSNTEHPVIETTELPLILVPSSVTAPYQQQRPNGEFGTIQISISYRQLFSSESKPPAMEDKLQTIKGSQQGIRWEHCVEEKENMVQNSIISEILQNLKTMDIPRSKETRDELTQTVNDRLEKSIETDDIQEQNFNFMRRCFWTGEMKSEVNRNNGFAAKDNHVKKTYKDKFVPKTFINNNEEFNVLVNNQFNGGLKKQLEFTKSDLGNEFSDSGVYSSSLRDRIPLHTKFPSSEEVLDQAKKNDFEIVLDEIDDNELTFYSLKSDLSCLSVIDEHPTTSETKQTNEFEEDKINYDIDSEQTEEEIVEGGQSSRGSDDSLDEIEKIDKQNLTDENTSNDVYFKEISQNDKSILSKEDTIEVVIESARSDHDNLVANEVFHQSESSGRLFKARVEIEQALNLPVITKCVNGEMINVAPSTSVSFKCGSLRSPEVLTTEIVRENCNPVWSTSWEVELDVELLEQVDKRLVFSVLEEDMRGDFVFGYAMADLSALPLGLTRLRNWLNISDLSLTCKGQLKVNITPLEDISKTKTKLAANLASAGQKKKEETHDCVYIAHGQFNTFPSFIASQTEVHITRMPSNLSCNSNGQGPGTSADTGGSIAASIKDKIAEMEEFISGLKRKSPPSSDEEQPKVLTNQENIHVEKEYQLTEVNIPDHEEVKNEEGNKALIQENPDQANNPCTSVCRGCHHCTCRHNEIVPGVEYFINPLVLQRFLSSISEININQFPPKISTSNVASNSDDYNFDQKHFKDKSTSMHKTTSCPQFEGTLSQRTDNIQDFILDQDLLEFEHFLQGKRSDANEVGENVDDLSNNTTRASEISTDKSDPVLEYCSIRETPEGGNPTVYVKRSKLERQGTYVVDKNEVDF